MSRNRIHSVAATVLATVAAFSAAALVWGTGASLGTPRTSAPATLSA